MQVNKGNAPINVKPVLGGGGQAIGWGFDILKYFVIKFPSGGQMFPENTIIGKQFTMFYFISIQFNNTRS